MKHHGPLNRVHGAIKGFSAANLNPENFFNFLEKFLANAKFSSMLLTVLGGTVGRCGIRRSGLHFFYFFSGALKKVRIL
jgi:hypothetical protein